MVSSKKISIKKTKILNQKKYFIKNAKYLLNQKNPFIPNLDYKKF